LHRGLRNRVEAAFERVRTSVSGIAMYLGYPEYQGEFIYNAGALILNGDVLAKHRKRVLPNYGVFDEKRYFQPGMKTTVASVKGVSFGLIICEDAWDPEPSRACAEAGAQVLLVMNGSPYHSQQPKVREESVYRALVLGTRDYVEKNGFKGVVLGLSGG